MATLAAAMPSNFGIDMLDSASLAVVGLPSFRFLFRTSFLNLSFVGSDPYGARTLAFNASGR